MDLPPTTNLPELGRTLSITARQVSSSKGARSGPRFPASIYGNWNRTREPPAAGRRELKYFPNGSLMFDPAPGAYTKVKRASPSGDVLIAETVFSPTVIEIFSSGIYWFPNLVIWV
jgi:hypothetical protein